MREDYSADGDAWAALTHDQARSKAYRWGEDGLAALCDRYQLLVFALALWNGRDPILKERLFGVSPYEGNHGEDVKEYYYYLDSTPTHSYLRYLYKYPQAPFPYAALIEENRRRQGQGPEYELLDTGVFDGDRYFDVFVEYAKDGPEDVCVRIRAINRGPLPAPLHLLPHLWFRNTWAWSTPRGPEPAIAAGPAGPGYVSLVADDAGATPLANLLAAYRLGERYLYATAGGVPLFTDNETDVAAVYGPEATGGAPPPAHVKNAFHRYVVRGETGAVNPRRRGTKACLHYRFLVPPGATVTLRLRLCPEPLPDPAAALGAVDAVIARRRDEADAFYDAVHPPGATADERLVQRQALAGLLWTKQVYLFDVERWLDGDDPARPPPEGRQEIRNRHWRHLNSMRVLCVPDKWEYPWFAAWDLALQCVPLVLVDPELAKEQLWLLLFEQFQHPNGQIPACEWDFSDLNPPVHAWACRRVYEADRRRTGRGDRVWLERCFHKLLINFAWWVNRVDGEGNNVFEGGFLGLDNITVVDRSQRLPGGAVLKQADGTGWMARFCLDLMAIALELAETSTAYEALATKFFEHFVYVAAAMRHMGERDTALWDERDGFFYDLLRHPDGRYERFRVRSLVGLIPLLAVEGLDEALLARFPAFRANVEWFLRNRKGLVGRCCHPVGEGPGRRYVLAALNEEQLGRVLARVLDDDEFLSDWGIRSLSRHHAAQPFGAPPAEVRYEPAESDAKLKGGNSNWRGPVWLPTSFLVVEALRLLGASFGPRVRVPAPGIAPDPITLETAAREVADRSIRLFTRDPSGRRPAFGPAPRFHHDPHWRDCLLFYEYFHGDDGAGLGASHQTGWTALVASLIDEWRTEASEASERSE